MTARTHFLPDQPWPDDNGVHINAHGGGILHHGGRYWWFGEHKVGPGQSREVIYRYTLGGKTYEKRFIGETSEVGVHCYSSTDLMNWRDEGIALEHPGDLAGVDRPCRARAKLALAQRGVCRLNESKGGGRQNCRFVPGPPRGLLEQQRQQPAVLQPQQQRSHEREQQRGFPRGQAPEKMPFHTARSVEVGKSFRSSAVSGTNPPSRADGRNSAGSNKPDTPAAASRVPKAVAGAPFREPKGVQKKNSPTSQSTESLSLRDFWHFACEAGFGAKSKWWQVIGDVRRKISPSEVT